MENTGKLWSKEDLDFIIENYPTKGSLYCSEILKREKKAIVAKAKRLGVKSNRTRYKYSKEMLEPIIKNSKNIREVLDTMGLRAAGGNYGIINKYIKKYNFNIDHFEIYRLERIKKLSNQAKIKQIPLDEVLVTGSTYNRTRLKKRLVNEGLLEYKCECGNTGEWQGKKLSLQLEHKNGVHNDNRLENLTFMCPNCHSQTDTFAGKSNRKDKTLYKKIITKDNKEIVVKIDRRFSINGKTEKQLNSIFNRRKVERPEYEQLKKEVEELGYSATGRKYGVRDNSIRKWMKIYEKYVLITKLK